MTRFTSGAGCGRHRVVLVRVGDWQPLAELDDITQVYWDRRRDDISEARVRMGLGCCESIQDLRTVDREIWIYRDDVRVWRGIVTRVELEWDQVSLFASDMMWVASKRAIEHGFNYEDVPVAQRPTAVHLAATLLREQCFQMHGDFWDMGAPGYIWEHGAAATDRKTATAANKWQYTVWEVIDSLARTNDLDYTCVNGQIHVSGVHTRWSNIPDLLTEHLSEYPRIVEYGNQYANRAINTDGSGWAGVAYAPQAQINQYGQYIDSLSNSTETKEETPDKKPNSYIMGLFQVSAQNRIDQSWPPPVAVVVPEGVGLMPSSPWEIANLVPGSHYRVVVEHPCRVVVDEHKLQELRVTDSENGEEISISSVPATKNEVAPDTPWP